MIDMNSKKKITLTPIKKDDHRFLFELLEQRQLFANISHKKMPTWDEHVEFVKSKPYLKWYIIYSKEEKIGTISLTFENEIGIFIKKGTEGKGIGSHALKMLIEKKSNLRYLANINPKNKESIKFFKKNRFKLIQYTYEITNSNKK